MCMKRRLRRWRGAENAELNYLLFNEARQSEQPAASRFYDGPVGYRTLLHGLSLQGSALGGYRCDGRIDLLLPRSRLLLKPRHQGRSGSFGCGREVSAATPAAQGAEAAGGACQSVCADVAFSGI